MNENVTRYPLQWPEGWPRTSPVNWQRSRFQRRAGQNNSLRELTFAEARDRLTAELKRLGATKSTISSNVPVRQDGSYYVDGDRRGEAQALPGVAVYFTLQGQARCLACDRYTTVAANMAALAAHIDALRAMERYGVGTLAQSFAGYTPRLPAATTEWWLVLNVPRQSSAANIDDAYRRLMREAHPDAGGSEYQAARLNAARDVALAEVAVR